MAPLLPCMISVKSDLVSVTNDIPWHPLESFKQSTASSQDQGEHQSCVWGHCLTLEPYCWGLLSGSSPQQTGLSLVKLFILIMFPFLLWRQDYPQIHLWRCSKSQKWESPCDLITRVLLWSVVFSEYTEKGHRNKRPSQGSMPQTEALVCTMCEFLLFVKWNSKMSLIWNVSVDKNYCHQMHQEAALSCIGLTWHALYRDCLA